MVVTITTSDVVAPLLIFSFIVMYRGKEGARGVEHIMWPSAQQRKERMEQEKVKRCVELQLLP